MSNWPFRAPVLPLGDTVLLTPGVFSLQNLDDKFEPGIKMKKLLLGTVALFALGLAAPASLQTLPRGPIRQPRLQLR